jgi:superfamily II DNA or RNA helicase
MREFLRQLNDKRLKSYAEDPGLIREHFGVEETVLAGGYGYRQVLELVQNGADALLEAHERGEVSEGESRIHVLVRGSRLYVANTGAELSEDGLDALLRTNVSPKRGNQIGRFGLGFKSLLMFSGRIDIFTASRGAIRFDPERCREELRRQFGVRDAPGLRLAWIVAPEERESDPTCAELGWAETIVRADVGAESSLESLRQAIRSFPPEFLLFFPVAVTLTLDDGEAGAREVRLERDGADHVLLDGADVSRWRVFSREARIHEPRAISDATHVHARAVVPVSWAMPLEGRREEAGRFWAFFPTHTPTYLPGILNAPWKLNSDRNAIIGGEWNAALMAEAASLIAGALPSLATTSDPGRPLDAFPRQMVRRDEDAAPLVDSLWSKLATAPVIPDGAGALRSAMEVWRHPRISAALASAWQSIAGTEQRRQLVHATCLESQRASRLDALAKHLPTPSADKGPPALRRHSTEMWFADVASLDTGDAHRVLQLAEAFSHESLSLEWSHVRSTLKIIPTAEGHLEAAPRCILAPEGAHVPGRECVSYALQAIPEARRILSTVLGVTELDAHGWEDILASLLNVPSWPADACDAGWKQFWTVLRTTPKEIRSAFLKKSDNRVLVRRRDARWVIPDRVLLPGGIVSENEEATNSKVLVDSDWHAGDGDLLEALGVEASPSVDIWIVRTTDLATRTEALYPWLDACRERYKSTHRNAAVRSYLQPDVVMMPRGYRLLPELAGKARALFTIQLLELFNRLNFQVPVPFGHSTMAAYPRIAVPHPMCWYLVCYGALPIGASTAPLRAALERWNHDLLERLPNWSIIEPACERLKGAFPAVSVTSADIREFWLALIDTIVTPQSLEGEALAELWLGAARDGVVPTELPAPSGRVRLSEVFVTSSADLARRARSPERAVVVLDESTKETWLKAGARDLAGLIRPEWDGTAGPPERLTDVVPELVDVLREDVLESARCQRVNQLRLRIADGAQGAACLMWRGTLLLDAEQLAPLSRAERLDRLIADVSAAGWLDGSPTVALQRLGDAGVDERRGYVAEASTLAERLLRAAGNRAEPLLATLGQPLRDMDWVRECKPQQLAELVLAQLGPAVLPALRESLLAEGLHPPQRWNTSAAAAFAAAIGFPPEFASSTQARREPEELVSGPIELPPLHDFQLDVFEGLTSLLSCGKKRRRAVVSLPTGGGKTRVTVEAAVRLVLAPEGDMRSVLWIAQTDELCEQAVQAFRQVWINLGARRTNLRIVRLWGGTPTPTRLQTGNPVVVVASIQTLKNRIGAAGLDLLRKPGLVVVDECHHAITPSYSALLRWLDAETSRPSAEDRDEPPIVGLSATPFRTDDDESQRLARRFDSHWLPSDQEGLYSRLRAQGVLSTAQYDSLESGIGLTDDELTKLERLRDHWEGLDFENLIEAINQRLAGDVLRNERLIECIKRCTEGSILFFTNSVAHAEEMAARLHLAGIGAAAISGSTPTVARRYFLERFREGQIRVLCNHSVLSTGFDAPKTDMVLIARQVFSPVRYMQMVGRGLRGEKNGGTESCRIVTVLDNLGRFADRHPYHYCRRYFSGMTQADAAF